MLPFFRKIRYRLASDNQFFKYSRYAIGEIFLVVIGILIALYINNWNQERIEIQKLNSNLSYLLEDIEQNEIQLNQLKDRRLKTLESCTELIDKYQASQLITEKVWNEAFFEIVIERQFRGNMDGFEKSKSSVIYETARMTSIRKLVTEYYELIKQLDYSESKLNVTIEEIERELFQNGFQDEIWDHVREEFMNSNKYSKWQNASEENTDSIKYDKGKVSISFLDVIKRYKEVQGIFLRYEVDVPFILNGYDAVVKKGRELENEVKNYLKINYN